MNKHPKHACQWPGCTVQTGGLYCRHHAALRREERHRHAPRCRVGACPKTAFGPSGLCRPHRKHRQCACGAWMTPARKSSQCAACSPEATTKKGRTASEQRAIDRAEAPVLPDEPEVTLVSMPVRPWVHRSDAGWLGVATWPDQVRRSVAAVDVSRVLDRSAADNSALFAGGAA